MEKVAVIIPVYNEAKVVKSVVEKVVEKYPNVICINDGSADKSSEEILNTRAILIEHPINLGQGAAIQTGIDYALLNTDAEYFVTFDSDGQHMLSDVERMLTVIQSENLDIVLGSRFLGNTENMPLLKKLILKLAIKFSNKTSGIQLTDTHNGLRVFNRNFADNLKLKNSDMTHASEIVDKIKDGNFKYTEVPVTIKYTKYSRSKGQSMANAINIGLDLLLGWIEK